MLALAEKRLYSWFLGALVALGPLALDAYLPAMPTMAQAFDSSMAQVNLTVSSYLLGSALGQFFGGALSDFHGRKFIGLLGIGIYVFATAAIIVAPSIDAIQLLRIVQALGAGFAGVSAIAQVRDVFSADQLGRRYANVMLVMLVVPLFAPLLGASLLYFSWQAIFYVLLAYGVCTALVFWLYVPETHLQRNTAIQPAKWFESYQRVLRHRSSHKLVALPHLLYVGFAAGFFLTFLVNSAAIFVHGFGVSQQLFAWVFASCGLAMVCGNRLAIILQRQHGLVRLLHAATYVQIAVSSILCVCLYCEVVSLYVILPLIYAAVAMHAIQMPTNAAAFMRHFAQNTGAAASLNSTFMLGFGSLIGGLAALTANGQVLPVFVCGLAATLAAACCLPYFPHQAVTGRER